MQSVVEQAEVIFRKGVGQTHLATVLENNRHRTTDDMIRTIVAKLYLGYRAGELIRRIRDGRLTRARAYHITAQPNGGGGG